jgi:hypothetical protein
MLWGAARWGAPETVRRQAASYVLVVVRVVQLYAWRPVGLIECFYRTAPHGNRPLSSHQTLRVGLLSHLSVEFEF